MNQDEELHKATTLNSNGYEGLHFMDIIRVSFCNI